MDRFAAQVSFNDFKINMENEALSVSNQKVELDALIDELKDDEHAVYCGTDTSLPQYTASGRLGVPDIQARRCGA